MTNFEPPGQFPHCDSFILHAPGECEYCDGHPDWQALRHFWGIAFTGHPAGNDRMSDEPVLPCPADFTRPPGSRSDHRRWGGNTATAQRGDPSMPRQTTASVIMYGDQGGREPWPLPERIANRVIRRPIDNLKKRLRGWHKENGFWVYGGHR